MMPSESTRQSDPASIPDGPAAGERPRRHKKAASSVGITIEGVLFITLTFLIGLAAINTGQNLLFLMFSLMLATLILSGLAARHNLRRLAVRRFYPLEFYAGQTVNGRIEIDNAKRLFASTSIGLEDVIGGPGHAPRPQTHSLRTFALMIPPRRRVSCAVRLTLPGRGLYTLRHVRILSRYPFGFFEKMQRHEIGGKLLVYPRLFPALAVLAHCPHLTHDLEVDRKGAGSSLFGVRDYQPGDPVRLIHWKLSAKGHGYKVKEFEQEESRSYRLMLDLHAPAPPSEGLLADFEKAVSITATLARTLLREEAAVGLWTSTGNIPLAAGPRHLRRIMRALAQIQLQPPEARRVYPEANGHGVTQIWIEYHPAGARPAGAAGPPRGADRRYTIDVRKVAVSEDPPPPSAAPRDLYPESAS